MLGIALALAVVQLPVQTPAAPFAAETFDPIVLDGIRRGAYPGAVLVMGRRDSVLYAKGYGHLTWSLRSPLDRPDSTIFDLASLSKPIATTTALMLLVDRGRVQLDATVATYLPDFRAPGTAPITVRMLLTHTSGLRADLLTAQLRALRSRAELLQAVYAESPRIPPGSRVVYSDLNAVLLGEIVARVSGEPLDQFVAREVFQPLAMRDARYRPPTLERPRIAPTGIWRGHPVAGEVNDPTAAKLGGVSGNAGVFATGLDLARFAQFLLREGTLPDGTRLVKQETVRLFTTRSPQADVGPDHRALGWQAVPTDESISSAGTLFGPRSFGHTGWTGTSLWIDPDRNLFVILLTNRAFAPRSHRSFSELKRVRGLVADAAARANDLARPH